MKYPPGRYVVHKFLKGSFATDSEASVWFTGLVLEVLQDYGDTIRCRWESPLDDPMRNTLAYRKRIEADGTMQLAHPEMTRLPDLTSPEMEAWCAYDQQSD